MPAGPRPSRTRPSPGPGPAGGGSCAYWATLRSPDSSAPTALAGCRRGRTGLVRRSTSSRVRSALRVGGRGDVPCALADVEGHARHDPLPVSTPRLPPAGGDLVALVEDSAHSGPHDAECDSEGKPERPAPPGSWPPPRKTHASMVPPQTRNARCSCPPDTRKPPSPGDEMAGHGKLDRLGGRSAVSRPTS